MRWIVPLLLATAPVQAASAQSYSTGYSDQRMSYVLLNGGGTDSMMSGSSDDYHRALAYLAGGTSLLFIRQAGAAYIIRDPALLRLAETIVEPQQALGRQQGALGRQQGALGRQQGVLGREQGRLGRMMAYSTPQQMHALGAQQRELGRRQSELGEQQSALGRQQSVLGREQARQAELAQPKFLALLTEAMQRGLAQRVD